MLLILRDHQEDRVNAAIALRPTSVGHKNSPREDLTVGDIQRALAAVDGTEQTPNVTPVDLSDVVLGRSFFQVHWSERGAARR